MKTLVLIISVTILVKISGAQSDSIDYFEQTPPGDSAVVFAPGIISKSNRSEGNIAFSPDGNRCLFHVIDNINWQWGDLYYSEFENDNWSTPARADFIETSKYFDIQPCFSPDGKTLFYSSLRPYKGYTQNDIYTNLWQVEYDSLGWKTPEKLNSVINSSNNDETFANLTLDRTFYFQKDQTGSIWYSKLEEGEFKVIRKIEKPVNSDPGYIHPYVARDGSYMILSSARNEGYGSFDLYITYNKEEGKWTNPKNLGDKINNESYETGPICSPDGKYMFFGRSNDIYWVNTSFIENLRHTNFTPYVLNTIPDKTDSLNNNFSYTIPDTTFIDDDGNETLTLKASLKDDSDLPEYLNFNPQTKTLSGVLSEAGSFDIKVTATDTAGASVSDVFRLTVERATAIDDFNINNNIIVFPNPTSQNLQICTNSLTGFETYQIVDLYGKIVKQGKLESQTINISTLAKGVYLLNLKTDKNLVSKKIVIE